MLKNIKNICILVAICSVMAVLLALTNQITAPLIEQHQNAAANEAFEELFPGGKFEAINLSKYDKIPPSVAEAYRETSGQGYVVKLVTSGYGSDMVIMCGVGSDGVVTGAVCLSSNETLSKEKTYGENFTGKDYSGVEAVDTIGGATKTTAAYKNVIIDAMNTAIIMGGGSVDLRSEEEILSDNLATALPAGAEFTELFLVEVLEGVDAVYEAGNGAGYVCVVGETFIGVDANGTVVTEGAENADQVIAAVTAVKETTYTEIDLAQYPDLEKTVLSAKVTASGNYVLETKGAGYGIKGGDEYHPASGEYIVVRVSITPDGQIIDCLTVYQAESANIGDACANESFYSQFDGKTEENYTEIDAIGGATMTTDGYKQAIQRAFDALHTLKGGA